VKNFSELFIKDFVGTPAFPKKEYAAIKLSDGSFANISGSSNPQSNAVIKERVK